MLGIQRGRAGAFVDGLETVERAIAISSNELAQRPQTLRVRGELRLEFGQTELADVDFRESIEKSNPNFYGVILTIRFTNLRCLNSTHHF
jgi:hypothetical protein